MRDTRWSLLISHLVSRIGRVLANAHEQPFWYSCALFPQVGILTYISLFSEFSTSLFILPYTIDLYKMIVFVVVGAVEMWKGKMCTAILARCAKGRAFILNSIHKRPTSSGQKMRKSAPSWGIVNVSTAIHIKSVRLRVKLFTVVHIIISDLRI